MKKIEIQYQKFKVFATDIVLDEDMDRSKRTIKEYAMIRTVTCFTCYRQYDYNKVLNHVKIVHKNEDTQFGEDSTKLSVIKVLHGICKEEKLYEDKKEFLALALKLLCKIPNESVVESIGSVAELHTKPNRNCSFGRFETELMIDWNGPNLSKAEPIIIKALDRYFGSRKKWHFRTGSNKHFVSKVVDGINKKPSRLCFLE